MKVLITGGSGFVGLALAEKLLADGAEVCLFSAAAPPDALAERVACDRLRIVTGDIRSADALGAALAASGATHLVHAAAITPGPERELREARTILEVNIGGTANAVACAAECGLARVVVLSSVAVYGFSPPAASCFYEEAGSAPAPATLYGISKLAAEQTALRLGALYKLDTRVARLGPVFGPWEYATGLRDAMSPHQQILAAARGGRSIVLPRPMPADWLYSRDAAAGLVKLLLSNKLTRTLYNLGAGRTSDLPQWCVALGRAGLQTDWRLAREGEEPAIRYNLAQDRAAMATHCIAAETGFRPRDDLDAQAVDYLGWAEGLSL
ncbi:NAD-dependent epimerase/dehydratase family protein [Methylobacterium indicum]|uniref:NAD-dependent epimerase/dehydratase family protein n=1 Tax=Methylobacterium indicum TaxID=1775910 RepID=UPI00069DA791|nr:NAD(P)-dependent oxidoreductase [Methylobacterium indicum]